MATDRGRHKPSTYRFSTEEKALMDRLGARLAPPGTAPMRRVDVIRHALHRLAESLGPEPGRKNPEKSPRPT
jgi:hypothetical protein